MHGGKTPFAQVKVRRLSLQAKSAEKIPLDSCAPVQKSASPA
mgnify:CR=1 FL=1